MNRKMMDILACPIDKHFPLELFECRIGGEAIVAGALYCQDCSRFYPIVDGIPIMLPDELRDRDQDMAFLGDNAEILPEKITRRGMPWHL